MNAPALITLSHGSRHPGARPGVATLTAAAAAQLGVTGVDAHLEFDTPDLTTAAQQLVDAGHTRAVVVPTLFTTAFHATNDVPEAIAKARAETGLDLIPAEGLGQGRDVAAILAARAVSDIAASGRAVREIILYPVGTSNTEAAAKTVELGRDVEKLVGIPVTTVPATGHGKRDVGELASVDKHLLPLFVTEGLLLDRAFRMWPGSVSAPLGADLAHVVASRYRRALAHTDALAASATA